MLFRSAEHAVRSRITLNLIEGFLGLLINMVTAIGIAMVMYIGFRDVQSNILTLGQMLLILNYVKDLYSPLKTMSRKMVSIQNQLAGAERVFVLLDEPNEVAETGNPVPLERAKGEISFQNVSFAYEKKRTVLQNATFEISSGTSVGILGHTGAGKSTITNLLLRKPIVF